MSTRNGANADVVFGLLGFVLPGHIVGRTSTTFNNKRSSNSLKQHTTAALPLAAHRSEAPYTSCYSRPSSDRPTNARQDYVTRARRTAIRWRVPDENRRYRIINDYMLRNRGSAQAELEDASAAVISIESQRQTIDKRHYQLTFAIAGHGPHGPHPRRP